MTDIDLSALLQQARDKLQTVFVGLSDTEHCVSKMHVAVCIEKIERVQQNLASPSSSKHLPDDEGSLADGDGESAPSAFSSDDMRETP